MKTLAKRLFFVLALPVVLIAWWWFASANSESMYFPPLENILRLFPGVWFDGGLDSRIVTDGIPSVARLLGGFALAILIAIPLGTLIGLHPRVRAYCEPTLELFRAIPGPVLVPIISLFAGIGDGLKIIVILTGCLWPILLNTVEGVRAVDTVMTETTRSYRFSAWGRIRHLVIPAAMPQIFAGMRQGLSVGIILMVISEMFAASNGLGFTVVQFQRTFAIPEMWTGIIVLGVLGVILAQLFRLGEDWALRWYRGMRRANLDS